MNKSARSFLKSRSLIAVLVLTPFAASNAAEMIVNGGFELPPNPASTGPTDSPTWELYTGTEVPGWTTDMGAGIEIQNHADGDPNSGEQHAELDSQNNSNMYQDVATEIGKEYVISFFYSPRPNISENSNKIEVYFEGVLQETIKAAGGAVTTWMQHVYNITALDTSFRLEFRAAGPNNRHGGYLDDVSMTPAAIPLPAAFWMLGAGLLSLFGVRKTKSPLSST